MYERTTQQQHVISNTNDLLLTSPTPLKDEPPNTLTVASNLRPQLGVSPLDQPLVNFSNVVHQEQVCYEFEYLVECRLSSERVTHNSRLLVFLSFGKFVFILVIMNSNVAKM